MATNGTFSHQEHYKSADAASATSGATEPSSANNLSKDEVGWYFVEQYYTTLSKSPEKLHLFYGKKSQFVYGLEAEVANVSVGRQAIQERIKALDFQDCKVRVSNVDSQGSIENIVIQVIGETSNKSGEPKKFVQTFILAQQPSGYFVLNDILRYIKEEGDEDVTDAADQDAAVVMSAPLPTEAEAEPEEEVAKSEVDSEDKVQLDPVAVNQKLEEVATEETASTPAIATPLEPAPAAQASSAPSEAAADSVPDPEQTAREVVEEELKKPELPKDPSPTPVVSRPAAPPAAEPEKPREPPKPMTWASRVGAAAPRPVVPIPKTATPPAGQLKTATPAAAAPAAASTAAPTTTATPAAATSAPAPAAQAAAQGPAVENVAGKEGGSEWQTAGADSKRQTRGPTTTAPSQEKEGTLGYVKYVTDKIKHEDLKAYLAQFGELVYFDINRAKNCAFVEYQTIAGYQAASSANPHTVNGEQIIVEARRPKASAYGGSNYNPNRGSISGRGRGGFEGGRGNQGGGGRGGFGGPTRGGRGGAGAPRGRGGPQVTNA